MTESVYGILKPKRSIIFTIFECFSVVQGEAALFPSPTLKQYLMNATLVLLTAMNVCQQTSLFVATIVIISEMKEFKEGKPQQFASPIGLARALLRMRSAQQQSWLKQLSAVAVLPQRVNG